MPTAATPRFAYRLLLLVCFAMATFGLSVLLSDQPNGRHHTIAVFSLVALPLAIFVVARRQLKARQRRKDLREKLGLRH